jgi:hypothetical protein
MITENKITQTIYLKMDIYSSIKGSQNRTKIIELYDTILSINSITCYDLNEICVNSWNYICQNAMLSSLTIKLISDLNKIDWKNILSLQFYDQIYFVTSLQKRKRDGNSRNNKSKKGTPSRRARSNGHCIGFACNIDGNIINGQTWDVNPKYTDVDLFEYPLAKTFSHHGILGGPYISKNKYSVTWTGTQSKVFNDYVPTPIFLFEAMNNIDIKSVEDFIDFERKFEHSASHSLTISDGINISYIERNTNSVSVSNKVSVPFVHCNTFTNTKYDNNIYDSFSLKRITQTKAAMLSDVNMTYAKLFDIVNNDKYVWMNETFWKTISAFVFEPKSGRIQYYDRNKTYYESFVI